MSYTKLPYGRQLIDEDDVAAVTAVLRGDWLTTGPAVARFEAALAAATGARHAVACSSGTAALHLGAMALKLSLGDAVVVPAITFLATANAMRLTGAEVVFCDVDPHTGLMGPHDFSAALDRAEADGLTVRAVAPVHLAGQICNMPEIRDISADRNIAVIEDACHALGSVARFEGSESRAGDCRYGTMATFSFHPVKTIAMGEGGAVTTNDDDIAEHLRRLRNHGMVRESEVFQHAEMAFAGDGSANPWYYEMPEIGLNYRASDLHCALGRSQLEKLGVFVEKRRTLVARYLEGLERLEPVVTPVQRAPYCDAAWHLMAVLVDFEAAGFSRAEVMRALADEGIGTQVHYIPVSEQPYYRARYGKLDLPGAARWYESALTLPLFAAMKEDDVDHVCSALARVIGTPNETRRKSS